MTWITRGRRGDAPALGRLMFRAVRQGALAYTVPQRAAWLEAVPSGRGWARRLARCDVFVARGLGGPAGFVAMTRSGYVDLAFVAPQAQGRGVFGALMRRLLAENPGLELTTHANLNAQPAFARFGFETRYPEVVARRGQRLRRAMMLRAP